MIDTIFPKSRFSSKNPRFNQCSQGFCDFSKNAFSTAAKKSFFVIAQIPQKPASQILVAADVRRLKLHSSFLPQLSSAPDSAACLSPRTAFFRTVFNLEEIVAQSPTVGPPLGQPWVKMLNQFTTSKQVVAKRSYLPATADVIRP